VEGNGVSSSSSGGDVPQNFATIRVGETQTDTHRTDEWHYLVPAFGARFVLLEISCCSLWKPNLKCGRIV